MRQESQESDNCNHIDTHDNYYVFMVHTAIFSTCNLPSNNTITHQITRKQRIRLNFYT